MAYLTEGLGHGGLDVLEALLDHDFHLGLVLARLLFARQLDLLHDALHCRAAVSAHANRTRIESESAGEGEC